MCADNRYIPIFLSVICQGLFANAAAPIALEMAAETTYPVGEETSATLLIVFFAVIMVGFIEFSNVISPVVMVRPPLPPLAFSL